MSDDCHSLVVREISAMKKGITFILCVFGLGVLVVAVAVGALMYHAQNRNLVPDPNCIASDKIRIQMKDWLLAVPRSDLKLIDEKPTPKDKATHKTCQRGNEAPFPANSIGVQVYFEQFHEKGKDVPTVIMDVGRGAKVFKNEPEWLHCTFQPIPDDIPAKHIPALCNVTYRWKDSNVFYRIMDGTYTKAEAEKINQLVKEYLDSLIVKDGNH